MNKLLFLTTLILSISLFSCEKENGEDPTPEEPHLVKIELNSFFPMDTSKAYVYKKSTTTYDDIDNGTDQNETTTRYDTISFQKLEVDNNIEYRKFDGLNFTTTANSISILANIHDSTEILSEITLAYTDVKDTTWSYNVSKNGYDGNLSFEQTYDESTEVITVEIPDAHVIHGLYQKYMFKKDNGMIYKHSQGVNIETTYELQQRY